MIKISFWNSPTFSNPSPNAKNAIVNNKWILGQKVLLIQGSRFDFKDFKSSIFIWTSVEFDLFSSFDVQFCVTFLIWFWINLRIGKTRIKSWFNFLTIVGTKKDKNLEFKFFLILIVLIIPFLVFDFWSLLATRLWKYKNIM